MTEDEKLRNAFERLQDGARQAQLRWVTVMQFIGKEVEFFGKKMN